MPLRVLIIGGGVAGLRIGTLLSENNISFKIVESRERLGGRVLTKHDNTEDYFDLGPHVVLARHRKAYRIPIKYIQPFYNRAI